ncbi:MAG: hypothetical protein O7I42_04375 [Alphaproteobacteria bacterium]|nr:hypothetical protein [Alphaproteobacteria bacterium]
MSVETGTTAGGVEVLARDVRETEAMAADRFHVKIAPQGMSLNDFVAMEESLFSQQGLDVEFDMTIFRGTQSSWKNMDYFERPQDKPFADGEEVIQGACE